MISNYVSDLPFVAVTIPRAIMSGRELFITFFVSLWVKAHWWEKEHTDCYMQML